jgi:hypothetical protein
MERNPYAPPVSPVADPAEARGERPKEVTQAVRLLWISLALSIAGLFMQPLRATTDAEERTLTLTVLIIGGGIGFGIWAWVVAKIARGRNWARITFMVLTVLGLVITPFMLPYSLPAYRAQPLSAVVAVLNAVLELIAFYLLLTAPARAWFKPQDGRVLNGQAGAPAPPDPPAAH